MRQDAKNKDAYAPKRPTEYTRIEGPQCNGQSSRQPDSSSFSIISHRKQKVTGKGGATKYVQKL